MIDGGDFSRFGSIEAVLLDPPDSDAVNFLATALETHTAPPEAVPELIDLLRSSYVPVRQVAALRLRELGTPDLIEPLRTTALNDADRMVRYYAVGGLEKATGGRAPSFQLFSEQEDAYMSKWKSWGPHKINGGQMTIQ
jgi:HEAT repeat protein